MYIAEKTRDAVHAGLSYPADQEELSDFLAELFTADAFHPEKGNLLGVIAPHIDLQIGPQIYVPAFKQLQAAEFDTVVILGTSHYSFEDLFLNGTLLEQKEFINLWIDHIDIDPIKRHGTVHMRRFPAPGGATGNSSVGMVAGARHEPATFGF